MARTDQGRPLDVQNRDLDRTMHTAWGMRLSSLTTLGQPLSSERNTTLNEKFNINAKAKFTTSDRLVTGFYTIGNLGHRATPGAMNIYINETVDHRTTDAALYNHMPFVLRRPNQDLTEEERQNYRLRRKESHNGVEYIAYYAKKFTTENLTRVLIERTNQGVVTTEEYQATESNLSPVPPVINPRQAVRTSNAKIHVSTGASITFDERDVEEYLNVCKIIYSDYRYAVISEIGIVMGVDDTSFTSPIDGVRHPELKGATISAFISTLHDVSFNSDGFIERLSLSNKIPLLTTSEVVSTVGNPGV